MWRGESCSYEPVSELPEELKIFLSTEDFELFFKSIQSQSTQKPDEEFRKKLSSVIYIMQIFGGPESDKRLKFGIQQFGDKERFEKLRKESEEFDNKIKDICGKVAMQGCVEKYNKDANWSDEIVSKEIFLQYISLIPHDPNKSSYAELKSAMATFGNKGKFGELYRESKELRNQIEMICKERIEKNQNIESSEGKWYREFLNKIMEDMQKPKFEEVKNTSQNSEQINKEEQKITNQEESQSVQPVSQISTLERSPSCIPAQSMQQFFTYKIYSDVEDLDKNLLYKNKLEEMEEKSQKNPNKNKYSFKFKEEVESKNKEDKIIDK